MKPLSQALQVARQLMASGKTGSVLADGLRPAVSILSPQEKRKLASLIRKEYFVLGHAAHDPNLYKNCQSAKIAKEKSRDPQLKILTYKTPMCDSCALHRQGSCTLMGGRLIDGPGDIPERAVQRTADLIQAEQVLPAEQVFGIVSRRDAARDRISQLHEMRSVVATAPDHSGDQKDMARSRVASSILDPSEAETVKPRRLVGPARKRNAERIGAGGIDEREDGGIVTAATRTGSLFDDTMEIQVPPDLGTRQAARVWIESQPELNVPEFSRTASSGVDRDRTIEAGRSLHRIGRQASALLARGQMTTRRASKVYHSMKTLMEMGAVPDARVAAIHRQLNALGGGMEL